LFSMPKSSTSCLFCNYDEIPLIRTMTGRQSQRLSASSLHHSQSGPTGWRENEHPRRGAYDWPGLLRIGRMVNAWPPGSAIQAVAVRSSGQIG
jgi:hypothetical protein